MNPSNQQSYFAFKIYISSKPQKHSVALCENASVAQFARKFTRKFIFFEMLLELKRDCSRANCRKPFACEKYLIKSLQEHNRCTRVFFFNYIKIAIFDEQRLHWILFQSLMDYVCGGHSSIVHICFSAELTLLDKWLLFSWTNQSNFQTVATCAIFLNFSKFFKTR